MRANLIAPALGVWLLAALIVCDAWKAPWYIGALAGFAIAAPAYWLWRTFKPIIERMFGEIPNWTLQLFLSGLCFATAPLQHSTPFWLAMLYGALWFAAAVRSYISRHSQTE